MVDRDPATLEGIAAAWQETTDALRESERRYRELVECSLGLICTHDLTGTILSINSASAHSLGYQPGHGVGRNLRDFLEPDKRHLFDDYLRRIQEQGHDAGMMSVVVVQRLPVPFVADAAMVHTAADDGSVRLTRGVHDNASHEPALASLAATV